MENRYEKQGLGNGAGSSLRMLLNGLALLFTFSILAQTPSGGWDSWATNGTAGNVDYGNGVIRLLSDVNTGCAAAAVHETSSQYDPTLGNFSKCYQVFFGCPGNDNIGSDANGDGVAFSFWKGSFNINNGLACGGGLGYMGAVGNPPTPSTKMFTIEFDTYSSVGGSGFDGSYGGGTTGSKDEIALHRDNDASDNGRITSADAGNLEDGLEHAICIQYNNTSHILTVSIDGVTKLSYDLTGSPYELSTYFGAGGLNQTWSSGKYGATNPTTVSNGANIAANLGGVPLCPAGIEITSPSTGAVFSGCPIGPITITATATPPAGNTVSYVEFFVDGVSIGTDNTANYSMVYNSPSSGSHSLTAVAHWSGGSTTTTAPATTITVSNGIDKTSTAPAIDGSIEALWSSYPSTTLGLAPAAGGGSTAPDIAASYKVMWDNTYLYVLIDVTDDVLVKDDPAGSNWQDDKVELYIDYGNNNLGSYAGSTDYDYGFVYSDATLYTGHGGTTGVTFAQATRAGGWVVEVRLPWSTLGGVPNPGDLIGFEVQVNDDDGTAIGGRDSKISWSDASDVSWNNPSAFGTLQFANCNPLPVHLLDFNGILSGDYVHLFWSSSLERNNQKFIVERSLDLTTWQAIGEVAGAGNSSQVNAYAFNDFDYNGGIAYYRLSQVDYDGSVTYSQVITIENKPFFIRIHPNPFENEFTISSGESEELEVSIVDVVGQLVWAKTGISGNEKIQVELPSGAYLMTIKSNSTIEQIKLIRK